MKENIKQKDDEKKQAWERRKNQVRTCLWLDLATAFNKPGLKFISPRKKKYVKCIPLWIYMAAVSNKSQQPTKNLHFSPSTPHTMAHLGKKNEKSKIKL